MTPIMSHGFHTCDLFEPMSAWLDLDELIGMCAVDWYKSADGFRTMTHYES